MWIENEPAAPGQINLFATLCEEGSQTALSQVESERPRPRDRYVLPKPEIHCGCVVRAGRTAYNGLTG